jgi:hypothetical protein
MKIERIKSMVCSPWRRGFLLIPLALVCLALLPQARAVCQEGCDLNNGNTFLGDDALVNNITGQGQDNTAIGASALSSNTEGRENSATGFGALLRNTTGDGNTANGSYALYYNTTGNNNTATGDGALVQNTTASGNTATGVAALLSNTTGFRNTANGFLALSNNATGANNTAEGYQALAHNQNGSNNVGLGFQALYNSNGSNNVALGFQAGNSPVGDNNVYIGKQINGFTNESNTTRISNIYTSAASGRAVYVSNNNKLGTLVSSRRFKEEIKPMSEASEAILALKPVTFHYKKEIEPNGGIMFGLIAEDVEKVDPELVTRNDKGEVETVRYEAVNAMLLNEFLKEHRKVEEQSGKIQQQEATITELRSTLAEQQKGLQAVNARLEQQASQIQKVSAQLGANRQAPQLVSSNP